MADNAECVVLVLPGLEGEQPWQVRRRSDAAVNAHADRHYPRRRPGVGIVGGNGRALVLLTADHLAAWVTTFPQYPMDGLDAWRCSIFRNTGPVLSSELIAAAMALTTELWARRPRMAGSPTSTLRRCDRPTLGSVSRPPAGGSTARTDPTGGAGP